MSDATWNFSRKSYKWHSFNGEGQALCRKNIQARDEHYVSEAAAQSNTYQNSHVGVSKCTTCTTKEAEHRARVERSMAPVNPYDQVCEGVVTPEGAAQAAGRKCGRCKAPGHTRQHCPDMLSHPAPGGGPAHLGPREDCGWTSCVVRTQAGDQGECCEHAPMYHGARGCDECGCRVPRPAIEEVAKLPTAVQAEVMAGLKARPAEEPAELFPAEEWKFSASLSDANGHRGVVFGKVQARTEAGAVDAVHAKYEGKPCWVAGLDVEQSVPEKAPSVFRKHVTVNAYAEIRSVTDQSVFFNIFTNEGYGIGVGTRLLRANFDAQWISCDEPSWA